MTTAIVRTDAKGNELDLATLTGDVKFEGLTPSYIKEVYDGLVEEEGEEKAFNFIQLLQNICGQQNKYDLNNLNLDAFDDLDFDEEDEAELKGQSWEKDPAANVKLVQALTKKPKRVGLGVVWDPVADEVVADTWDDDKEMPKEAPIHILMFHDSRVYFKEAGDKRPSCSSRNGKISSWGTACQPCPLRMSQEEGKGSPCKNATNAIAVTPDLRRLIKIPFAKTNLRAGRELSKQFNSINNAFSRQITLSTKLEKGDVNEWFLLEGRIGSDYVSGAVEKALQILAEMYVGFFTRQYHADAKKYKETKVRIANGEQVGPLALDGGIGSKRGVDTNFFKNKEGAKSLTEGQSKPEDGGDNEPDLSAIGG